MKKNIYPIVLILILMGCSSSKHDEAIFENQCPLPCWNNIIPGITTENEINSIEGKIPYIDVNQKAWKYNWRGYDAVFKWDFLGTKDQGGEINIKNGLVESIYLFGGFDVPLDKIILTYGEPDFVIIGQKIMPNSIGTSYQNQVNLIYRTKGLIIGLEPTKKIIIKHNTKIDRGIFFNIQYWSDIEEATILPGLLGNVKQWDWQGYGIFDIDGLRN